VWAVLGVGGRSVTTSFTRQPTVAAVRDEKGARRSERDAWVEYLPKHFQAPELVSVELWTPRLLDRAELRRLCDATATSPRSPRARRAVSARRRRAALTTRALPLPARRGLPRRAPPPGRWAMVSCRPRPTRRSARCTSLPAYRGLA